MTGPRTWIRHRLPAALLGLGLGFGAGWLAVPDGHHHSHEATPGNSDFHSWLHQHLEVTPEQDAVLHPHEQQYDETSQRLRAEISAAGADLAAAIGQQTSLTPEIQAAMQRLHTAQAQLQTATLDHFFTMKRHLSPEQAERMRTWTQDRLLHDR